MDDLSKCWSSLTPIGQEEEKKMSRNKVREKDQLKDDTLDSKLRFLDHENNVKSELDGREEDKNHNESENSKENKHDSKTKSDHWKDPENNSTEPRQSNRDSKDALKDKSTT